MDDTSKAREEYEIQLYGFPITELREARKFSKIILKTMSILFVFKINYLPPDFGSTPIF